MKVIIPGGSGQVGTVLARAMHADGHDVCVLSRHPGLAPWRMVAWDGRTRGAWASEVDGADVVINLAGRSVNCRYNARNRRLIAESRVESTRVIGEVISQCQRPPRVWLQASTATIYAHRFDAANDEVTGNLGGGEPNAPDTWRSISRRGRKRRPICADAGGNLPLPPGVDPPPTTRLLVALQADVY